MSTKKKRMATKFTQKSIEEEDHSPPPSPKRITEANLMMDDHQLDSSSLPIEENPNHQSKEKKKKKNLVKKIKNNPTTTTTTTTTHFDNLQSDAVDQSPIVAVDVTSKKRSVSTVSTNGTDANNADAVTPLAASSPNNSSPAKKKRLASSSSIISAPAKKSKRMHDVGNDVNDVDELVAVTPAEKHSNSTAKKKTLDIGNDVHDAAELAVTPAEKHSNSSAKKKRLDVGADDGYDQNAAADDEVLLDVTPTKKRSTSSTEKTKKTLDIELDGNGGNQLPGPVISLPHITTFEKDGNLQNALQESPQLGAQNEYVAHSSPVNTRGDKTPDIDELTASNDVLSPENGTSYLPLNTISRNSAEPTENGVVHATNIQPNGTTSSNDLLIVMVADAFGSDPPLHDGVDDSENVDVNGFNVSRKFEDAAREILDKHGNIFVKASTTGYLRSLVFNDICAISDKLARFTVPELSLAQLMSMSQNVQELLELDVEVTWLAESLEELIEIKKMQPQLHHLLKERKQKAKIVAELEKEKDLQVKIAQKAKQKVDDIDIKVKTVTEEIDSIYQTVMSNVTKMQQYKDKPAKDVVGL